MHSASSATTPAVSIVVPTRNEAGNILALVSRLEDALSDTCFEIIFVDDSDDNTPEVVEDVRNRARPRITLIHRERKSRIGGLGGAVVLGMRSAVSPWVCVMDADLQHPPEMVPNLLIKTRWDSVDVVVASRYTSQGEVEGGLNSMRRLVSRGTTGLAQLAFSKSLRSITDPMSGFFIIRRNAIDLDELRPRGFKILLEILARNPTLRSTEVGFSFGKRFAGESKASAREGLRYLLQLAELRLGTDVVRFSRFVAVGLTGVIVNMLVMAAATESLGIFYMLSALIATVASTLWNFSLTDWWVFPDRGGNGRRINRLALFAFMNASALLFRGPVIYLLTSILIIHYLISNFISLLALAVLRFGISDSLIWKGDRGMATSDGFSYDIHGIVTVRSDVALPELTPFRHEGTIDGPMIDVRIGSLFHRARFNRKPTSGKSNQFSYQDGLGRLGFMIDVNISDTVDIVASPMLRFSPHVLYTNVVEPILRWTFVKKGYALVHGACISFGSDAYLVTAKTDTGKTTTILRILDKQRRASDDCAFVSDDLTLISPDRNVLTYPKPLTISRHTVAAVNTPALTRKQRLSLFAQSRLHSRGGRQVALQMSRSHLPMATINTITQWLVPPPKYRVGQLIPRVKLAHEAKLAGIFVIERGGDGEIILDDESAIDILLSNCDDAYGFPPYPSIKEFLHGTGDFDLRPVEQSIVRRALTGLPASLLQSSTMDWSHRIPMMVSQRGAPRSVVPVAPMTPAMPAASAPAD